MTHSPSAQVVAAARDFYLAYAASCPPSRCRQPLGVAINRNTFRCSLIFKEQSSLLMHEVLVPISAIKAGGFTRSEAHLDRHVEARPSFDIQTDVDVPEIHLVRSF